jgi:hypothetical protein
MYPHAVTGGSTDVTVADAVSRRRPADESRHWSSSYQECADEPPIALGPGQSSSWSAAVPPWPAGP